MRTGESIAQLRPAARRAGGSKLRAAARPTPVGASEFSSLGCSFFFGDCLRWQRYWREDDGDNFLDGRDRLDGNQAAPRAGNFNQEKEDANRIHPGELEVRVPVGRWQAQPGKIRFASMLFIKRAAVQNI